MSRFGAQRLVDHLPGSCQRLNATWLTCAGWRGSISIAMLVIGAVLNDLSRNPNRTGFTRFLHCGDPVAGLAARQRARGACGHASGAPLGCGRLV